MTTEDSITESSPTTTQPTEAGPLASAAPVAPVAETRPKRPPGLKQYVWVMRFYGFLYAIVGSLFFLFPNQIFVVLNAVPTYLHYGTPIPDSTERFWLVLATS